jgi:RNA ligase (TIGR02306 family)
MGIVHYEPPLRGAAGTFGEAEAPPTGMRPVYDLEHHKRHGGLLIPGERVIISEKLHGANARYCFHDGRMYAGSRKEWKREGDNIWWKALRANMEIEGLCRENPGLTLYGEIYGDVQDLRYGMKRGEVDFAAFDLYRGANPRASAPRRLLDRLALALGYQRIKRETGWLPYDEARTLCDHYGVQWVPVLFDGPYEPASLPGYTDGPTTLGGDHVREGCVVRPARERMDTVIGRVHLKLVSAAYLERSMKETA